MHCIRWCSFIALVKRRALQLLTQLPLLLLSITLALSDFTVISQWKWMISGFAIYHCAKVTLLTFFIYFLISWGFEISCSGSTLRPDHCLTFVFGCLYCKAHVVVGWCGLNSHRADCHRLPLTIGPHRTTAADWLEGKHWNMIVDKTLYLFPSKIILLATCVR